MYASTLTLVMAAAAIVCAVTAAPSSSSLSLLSTIETRNPNAEWPYLPWLTHGRDVINSKGDPVTIIGVNWPGAGEAMVPEGLQYASAQSIVQRIAAAGFNFVRHTYAIEMIDQVYERNMQDVTLLDSFVAALGVQNGTRIVDAIVAHNADTLHWTPATTRLQVLADIARLEYEAGVMMHLDNHVSKAEWCCSHTDGNAWFDDVYFDVPKWTRGLAFMADWAKGQRNVASMSLRNELRSSANITTLQYNWLTWAGNVTLGADAIHQANQDLLITIGGIQYDHDLSAVTLDSDLKAASGISSAGSEVHFRIDDHAWRDKAVLELHRYGDSANEAVDPCEAVQAELYRAGFNALGMPNAPRLCSEHPQNSTTQYECHPAKRVTPVWLTEFGQEEDASLYDSTLTNCIRNYTLDNRINWAVWGLAGSYYTREGTQDMDDSWGLLNHDWSDWRDPSSFDGFWRRWIEQIGKTNLEKP